MTRSLQPPHHSRDGVLRAPRSALVPGAIKRREWLNFLHKVQVCDTCTCGSGPAHPHWLWIGSIDPKGYARFQWRGRNYHAYRFAFIALGGCIPEGLHLDHLCRVHRCVTPHCLEPVTQRENIMRGVSFIAVHASKTHCPQGHPLSGENLVAARAKNGERLCRICDNEYKKAQYEKHRQTTLASHRAYYLRNKETIKAKGRQRYLQHKERGIA